MQRGAGPARSCPRRWRRPRLRLTEAAADFDDAVMADFLDGKRVDGERLRSALRRGTLACRIFPVLLGAALRNKGIQPLLDAVGLYLPSPLEAAPLLGHNPDSGAEETLTCDPAAPLRALAFKVMADEGRRLTYLRIYSGTLHAGMALLNSSRRSPERIRRLFRMHAHRREEISEARAGDIVAALGCQETLTGDTLCDPARPLLLAGLTVPEPVVSLAVEAKGAEDRERLPLALEQLRLGRSHLPGARGRGDRPDDPHRHGGTPSGDRHRPARPRVRGAGEDRPAAGGLPGDPAAAGGAAGKVPAGRGAAHGDGGGPAAAHPPAAGQRGAHCAAAG